MAKKFEHLNFSTDAKKLVRALELPQATLTSPSTDGPDITPLFPVIFVLYSLLSTMVWWFKSFDCDLGQETFLPQ